MQQAKEAMDKNDIDNARAGLLAALDGHPTSALLLAGLAQVEVASGQRDEARKYVDRGLKEHPDNPMLRQLDMSLRYEDPVQATLEYVKAAVPDAKAQAEQLMVTMSNMYEQQLMRAEQLQRQRQAEESAKAGAMSARALTEADRAADELERLDPENVRLLDYRFNRALASKDWTVVDRLQVRARELNLDEAGGLVYKGRAEVVRGNYRDAVASLEQASEKLSFSSAVWRLLAVAYQNLGNFAQAERAYEQAYRCNPNDIAGARAYIGILQRRGDKSRALEILQGVCRLAPNDLVLREAWLMLEAEVGSKAVALRERQKIHKASPDDQENAAALAMLLVTITPTRETIWNDQDQPLYSEERWKSLRGTDREQTISSTRERWRVQSESIMDALGKSLGDDLRVAALRARARKESGDILAGEIILREFIDRREPAARSEDMFVELGRYQAAINHYTDAVESLQQAVDLNGPKQREARISLAMLLMQLRRHDEALTNLEAALAVKDDQGVRLQIIECLINLKRFDDAEQRLTDSSLAVGGSMTTLLAASVAEGRALEQIAKGQVAEAERHVAQQRDLLSKAETQDPGNPLPRILMAQSLFHEYQRTQRPSLLDDAMAALDRADRIRAGSAEAAAMRVAILQARGDRNSAIAQLRQMLDVNPDNISARRDLIQMHIDVHDATGAAAEIEAAIQQNPTIAAWHELRGDLVLRSGGDPRQAAVAFARAHELQPDTGILLKLVTALMLSKPPNCQAAAERLAQQIEINADDPVVHEAYAQALSCLGKREQAIEQLRLAYAGRVKTPQVMRDAHTSASWFVALGSVYPAEQTAEAESLVMDLCAGKPSVRELREIARLWYRTPSGLDRALELQRQAVTLCPPEESDLRASVNYDLASFLLASGDVRGAAEAYDIVLRIQPTNVSALNNLAYVRAEELADAPAALPLADRLLQLAPQQAPVLDTVGWVYFKNGDLEKARDYLQQSVTIQPAVDTYVHLAAVVAKMGDGAGAENQLKEAEKLRPDARSQQKIKALRDDIEKSRQQAPAQPVEQTGSN
jgi:tetratricopeptide (TPR) repeat protein